MINSEHVIVQHLVSLISAVKINFNILYPMSITKIVEITYAIYQGLSKRRLCKEYVGRKVNNMPRVNLRQKFKFAGTPSFSHRVITCLEPAIQWNTFT